MIPLNILCPECFKGHLGKVKEGDTICTCDHCGTDFVHQGGNRVRYAKESDYPKPPAKPGEDGGVRHDGSRCSIHSFSDRKKYNPGEAERKRMDALPYTDLKTIPDANDGSKYEWVEVGDTKYGRYMYCLKTGIKRSSTMGEFYQSSPVD